MILNFGGKDGIFGDRSQVLGSVGQFAQDIGKVFLSKLPIGKNNLSQFVYSEELDNIFKGFDLGKSVKENIETQWGDLDSFFDTLAEDSQESIRPLWEGIKDGSLRAS